MKEIVEKLLFKCYLVKEVQVAAAYTLLSKTENFIKNNFCFINLINYINLGLKLNLLFSGSYLMLSLILESINQS